LIAKFLYGEIDQPIFLSKLKSFVDEKLVKAHKKLSETIEMEHEVLNRISVLRNEEKDILLNKENLLKEIESFNTILEQKSNQILKS
jgi:hypothetical protein